MSTRLVLPVDALLFPSVKLRQELDEEYLKGLAESIKKDGVIEPIVVRPREGNTFEVAAGEQRVRAARMARLTEVPVTVRELSDKEAFELGLTENLQRKDLTPYEIAKAFRIMMKTWPDLYPTQISIAARFGKSEMWVSKHMAVLDLEESLTRWGVSPAILQKATPEQAEAIRQAPTDKRAKIIRGIVETGTIPSRREIEQIVSPEKHETAETEPEGKTAEPKPWWNRYENVVPKEAFDDVDLYVRGGDEAKRKFLPYYLNEIYRTLQGKEKEQLLIAADRKQSDEIDAAEDATEGLRSHG